jgi:group I intron endonuclease
MKRKVVGIYCIENTINHKKYVGWAVDIKRRFYKHKWDLRNNVHINKHLQRAWNKYGEDIFEFWIIEEYPKDEELLKLMEIYFIAYYNAYRDDGGYNLTRGGEGTFGKSPSEETRKKIGDAGRGRHRSEEEKKRISEGLMGHGCSDETREKMRMASTGRHHSKETRELIGNSRRGKHTPQDVRDKISKSGTGKVRSDATRKNLRESKLGDKNPNFGKHPSQETINKFKENYSGEKCYNFGTKNKNSSSKYFGVSKNISTKKRIISWAARVSVKGKVIVIKYCKNEEEAAHSYDKYIVEHELPNPLNFPEEWGR